MAGLTTYFVANVAPGHASFKPSYAQVVIQNTPVGLPLNECN